MSVIFAALRPTSLSLLVAIGLAYATAISQQANADPPKEPEAAKDTVKLVIDYGDGVQKVFASIPWTKETTVMDALETASKHPRGIKFTHQGKGEAVLVTS